VVWGIASADNNMNDVRDFRDALGLTFPILWDGDAAVYESYGVLNRYNSAAFPKDYIIDASGIVAYVNNGYEPDEWIPIIEEELGLR
jgi:peroxiredoxin